MATASKAAPKPGQKADEGDIPAKKSNKLLFLILGAALLSVGAAGGTWFYLGGNQPGSEAQAAKPPVFMPLELFTVNLQLEEFQQYLQVAITVQVADRDQVELLKTYMPQVRNRLLMLLSSKKASELMTTEGKRQLSAEIIAKLRQPFTEGGPEANVSDVLFTSFVVQ